MIELTNEDIREFREIWKAEFNEEISEGFARQRAMELIELYELFSETIGRRANTKN